MISSKQKCPGKCLDWIIDSVSGQTINMSKDKLLSGTSYTKLPKELHRPKRGWINSQNI